MKINIDIYTKQQLRYLKVEKITFKHQSTGKNMEMKKSVQNRPNTRQSKVIQQYQKKMSSNQGLLPQNKQDRQKLPDLRPFLSQLTSNSFCRQQSQMIESSGDSQIQISSSNQKKQQAKASFVKRKVNKSISLVQGCQVINQSPKFGNNLCITSVNQNTLQSNVKQKNRKINQNFFKQNLLKRRQNYDKKFKQAKIRIQQVRQRVTLAVGQAIKKATKQVDETRNSIVSQLRKEKQQIKVAQEGYQLFRPYMKKLQRQQSQQNENRMNQASVKSQQQQQSSSQYSTPSKEDKKTKPTKVKNLKKIILWLRDNYSMDIKQIANILSIKEQAVTKVFKNEQQLLNHQQKHSVNHDGKRLRQNVGKNRMKNQMPQIGNITELTCKNKDMQQYQRNIKAKTIVKENYKQQTLKHLNIVQQVQNKLNDAKKMVDETVIEARRNLEKVHQQSLLIYQLYPRLSLPKQHKQIPAQKDVQDQSEYSIDFHKRKNYNKSKTIGNIRKLAKQLRNNQRMQNEEIALLLSIKEQVVQAIFENKQIPGQIRQKRKINKKQKLKRKDIIKLCQQKFQRGKRQNTKVYETVGNIFGISESSVKRFLGLRK